PPETSICAASAAHASRKLAATTAAPKMNRAATGSRCRPTIRTATAGTMNSAVMSAERVRVRRGDRDTAVAGAAGLSIASISSFGRECRSLVLLRLVGRANCFTKLPESVHVSNVVDTQSDVIRCPVFAVQARQFQKFGYADPKLWQTCSCVVVVFYAGFQN